MESMRQVLDSPIHGTCGASGDAFECGCRAFSSGRRVLKTARQGCYDGCLKAADGKRYSVEFKTACGNIRDTLRAQVIVYCILLDPDLPPQDQGRVFTREEWQALLDGYTGRGNLIRLDSKTGDPHIQSFYGSETVRPKASKPLRAYLDAACLHQPTFREWTGR